MSIFTGNIRFFLKLTSISNKHIPDEEKVTKTDFILLFVLFRSLLTTSILKSARLRMIKNHVVTLSGFVNSCVAAKLFTKKMIRMTKKNEINCSSRLMRDA